MKIECFLPNSNFSLLFFQSFAFRARVSSKVEIRPNRFPRRETPRKFVSILYRNLSLYDFCLVVLFFIELYITEKRFS